MMCIVFARMVKAGDLLMSQSFVAGQAFWGEIRFSDGELQKLKNQKTN